MEDEKVYDGVVIYCDASARPNPGKLGLGAHGYFYNYCENEKQHTYIENILMTDKGYINVDSEDYKENGLKDAKPVYPCMYIDFIESVTFEGTNNRAEARCLRICLERLKEFRFNKLFVLCDSEYVVNGCNLWAEEWEKNDWKRRDGMAVLNSAEWIEILNYIRYYKSTLNLTISWVRGHNDDFGNVKADYLSVIAMNLSTSGIFKSEFKISTAKGYHKVNIERHPFLNFKRLYFNSKNSFNLLGSYFLADPGVNDLFIGKRVPETGFSVIKFKETDSLIDSVIKRQEEVSSDQHNNIIMLKMDRLYHKSVYPYVAEYGGSCLLKDKKTINLVFLDNKFTTVQMSPTGLSLRAIETFNFLDNLLEKFIRYSDIGFDNDENNIDLARHDLTDFLYDKTYGKNKVKYELKKELGVGIEKYTHELKLGEAYNNKEFKIPLIFGLDILPRNNLKKLETSNPIISLITWKDSNRSFRYATVINCDSGIGIWSNFFSDKIFF